MQIQMIQLGSWSMKVGLGRKGLVRATSLPDRHVEGDAVVLPPVEHEKTYLIKLAHRNEHVCHCLSDLLEDNTFFFHDLLRVFW